MYMLKFTRKRVLIDSNFKILEKLGYNPQLLGNEIENEVISQIVLWTIFCILVSGILGFIIGSFGEQDRIPKGMEIILPIVISGVIGFDLVKEVPSTIINAGLSRKFTEGVNHSQMEQNSVSENASLEKSHLYYISRLSNPDIGKGRELQELHFDDISPRITHKILAISSKEYERDLQDDFTYLNQLRAIRCSIHSIPKETFEKIALIASMKALKLDKSDKLEMNNPEYSIFLLDVYSYLQAWMICSIDNDAGISMPKTTIGMNYPNQKDPDVQLYLNVFRIIRDNFQKSNSALRNHVDDCAIRTIIDRVDELIEWIENY
jgi:hypothetical protein